MKEKSEKKTVGERKNVWFKMKIKERTSEWMNEWIGRENLNKKKVGVWWLYPR